LVWFIPGMLLVSGYFAFAYRHVLTKERL
jgi:hypothetical protein